MAVAAQTQAQAEPAPQPQQLERVEITGSSIKRIDAESALPVQVITREQIQKTGATNVERLLQTISSVSSSGGLTTASAAGAATGGISAISLHGLTSIRTLVLINGRRIAPYGIGFTGDSVSVDVNQHSAGGDRARRDPEGRRLGGVRARMRSPASSTSSCGRTSRASR